MNNVVPINGGDQSLFEVVCKRYKPAKPEQIAELFAILAGGFPQGMKTEAEAYSAVKAYILALEGYPHEPIEMAVKAFLRGEVEGHSRGFMPSAAELTREARKMVFMLEYQARKQNG